MQGRLDKRIVVWGNIEFDNEIDEKDFGPREIKTIWAQIIPQTSSLQKQQTDTILSNTTHKVIVRYGAGKDITQDMWFIYQGHRLDIKYVLDPYFSHQFLEIFCEEIIGG
ncbi:phage head-tail adaptor [Clostridium sp. DL-VIII]|uniref:phage head closure protein n=1 Tax=Clostridium sp. DL-VIII TaxID=641107 RepID=UPI00023AF83C|nr:phage head closure protein [Clostridium sp. DL-VIII]EHI98040.1 phage head-tail adaptor [Clostridium sp. DL-VIII]